MKSTDPGAPPEADPYDIPGLRDVAADVAAFHRACETPVPTRPTSPSEATRALRSKLIGEEMEEAVEAMACTDMKGTARELVDLVYVTVGTLLHYRGLPENAWYDERVHRRIGFDALYDHLSARGHPLRTGIGFEHDAYVDLNELADAASICCLLIDDDTGEADRPRIIAALADLVLRSVRVGMACGLPLQQVWRRVHLTNMAKINPEIGFVTRRADGKILKPMGWSAPDVESLFAWEAADR